ncbi:hypothetical protein T11_14627 [Trichinella zimbabwensis]|uniref:Uncharacterized protein n=1 Tax=Trichinella zimbabwensis TaxID=268475 RepID=A0A0V1GPI2_9BILA|nr:hypothetical protein T11_2885 [Trichinella zimbabwensis]KRZ13297.1 hypothetical protein T11_14627 [Trichinella zimbabwensis]
MSTSSCFAHEIVYVLASRLEAKKMTREPILVNRECSAFLYHRNHTILCFTVGQDLICEQSSQSWHDANIAVHTNKVAMQKLCKHQIN